MYFNSLRSIAINRPLRFQKPRHNKKRCRPALIAGVGIGSCFAASLLQASSWTPLFDSTALHEGELHGQAGWLSNGVSGAYVVKQDPAATEKRVIHQLNDEVTSDPFVWIALPEKIEGSGTLFYRQRIESDPGATSTRQSWQLGLNSAVKAEGNQRYDFNVRKEIDWNQHRAADERDGNASVVPFAWLNFWLVVDTDESRLKIYRTRDNELPSEEALISTGLFREATHELSFLKLSRGRLAREWTSQYSDFYVSNQKDLTFPPPLKERLAENDSIPFENAIGTWSYNGVDHHFRISLNDQLATGKAMPAAVYLRNLPRPRLGTDSDEVLLQDLIDQKLLVIEMDCRKLPPETPELERALYAFHRALTQLVPAASKGRITVDERQIYTIPGGYRLKRNLPYWNIARHGAHGSLERVLEVYNTTVAERFGIEPVESIEAMQGSAGQPFDYNLYIDIVYPSGEGVSPVPTIAHFATICPVQGTFRSGERRIIPIGWLTSGYALALVDHVYNPPARTRYYGHFNPGFTLDNWNGVAAGSAAIRYLRAHAENFNLNGRIGALGHSKSSYTVARLADPKHAQLDEHETFEGFAGGSPEAQPWRGPESTISVAYASMGMGTRRIQYYNERTVPMVLAVGYRDHFDHWQAFPELIAHCEALDHNHLALWMEELGHTFPSGLDQATGQERVLLMRGFFDQHLNPYGNTALKLIGIIPAEGAKNVQLDGKSTLLFVEENDLPKNFAGLSQAVPITVRFARPIDLEQLAPQAMRVVHAANDTPVSGEWRSSLNQTRFHFIPNQPLSPDTDYVVIVETGIPDQDGNTLLESHRQSFRTESR